MGDSTTTRRELDHRKILRDMSAAIARKQGFSATTELMIYSGMLDEYNKRGLLLVKST